MSGPKFSAILPVYNGLPYLEKTLQAVLNQDYPPFEVLVTDDGSKDASPELLEKYKGRVSSQRIPNSGISVARNAAAERARGDWLAFCDADDVWFPGYLKRAAELIQKYPEVDFIASNYAVRYEHLGGERGGRLFRHYSTLKDLSKLNFDAPLKHEPFELLLNVNYVGTPSAVLVKKELHERIGGFTKGLTHVEDLDYYLSAAAAGARFMLIKDIQVFKRTHATNISGDKLKTCERQKALLISVLSKHRSYIESRGLTTRVREAIALYDYEIGNLHYEAGRRRQAFGLFFEGARRAASPLNLARFAWTAAKKTARSATFGLLSRKKAPK